MDKAFYTVGIGASAGGQESLCEFFDHVSDNLHVAFVVVTHLMRDRESVLNRILSRHTAMQVIRVEQDMPISPGFVYVLKENNFIEVKDGWLRLTLRDTNIQNSAVDIFFNSLAEDFRDKSVGIILSGGGMDGLNGALKINKLGGIVLVEDPKSAKFNGMPSAITKYDHPIAIKEPAELAVYFNHICRSKSSKEAS